MIRCECGQVFHKVSDLNNVKQVGLALYGDCTKCGKRLGINSLWVKTETIDLRQNQQKP